jgi:hypothetical protein
MKYWVSLLVTFLMTSALAQQPTISIPNLPAAGPITSADQIIITQGDSTRRVTAGAIRTFILSGQPAYLPLTGGQLTGDLKIRSAVPPQFVLDAGTVQQRNILGQTNSSTRWRMVMGNSSPETGSNAGSDFLLQRFADDGTTILGTVFTINRATGLIRLAGQMLMPPVTPAASTDACAIGTIQWDANYIYVCTAANTWKRAALAPF